MTTKIRFAEWCEFLAGILLAVMTGFAGWKLLLTYHEWGYLLGNSIPIYDTLAKSFIMEQAKESLRLCGIGWMVYALFSCYRIVVVRKEQERV